MNVALSNCQKSRNFRKISFLAWIFCRFYVLKGYVTVKIYIKSNWFVKNFLLWHISKENILNFCLEYKFALKTVLFVAGQFFNGKRNFILLEPSSLCKLWKARYRTTLDEKLELFSSFGTVLIHNKWIGTRLLSPERERTIYFNSSRTRAD